MPEKVGSKPLAVRVRLRLRDESITEGTADVQPSVASGGFTDWHYTFDARRPLSISSIFSVTIWIGDQMLEVLPW